MTNVFLLLWDFSFDFHSISCMPSRMYIGDVKYDFKCIVGLIIDGFMLLLMAPPITFFRTIIVSECFEENIIWLAFD